MGVYALIVLFNYLRLLVLYYRVKSSSYNALIQELRRQLVFVSSAGRNLCHIATYFLMYVFLF